MDYYSFPELASDSFCKICPFLSKENYFYLKKYIIFKIKHEKVDRPIAQVFGFWRLGPCTKPQELLALFDSVYNKPDDTNYQKGQTKTHFDTKDWAGK